LESYDLDMKCNESMHVVVFYIKLLSSYGDKGQRMNAINCVCGCFQTRFFNKIMELVAL